MFILLLFFDYKNVKIIIMNVLYFLTPKSQIRYVNSNMSLRQVLEIMEHYRYTTLPIIDNDGFYIGSISEGDLLFFIKDHPFSSIENFNKINIMNIQRNRDYVPVFSSLEMDELISTAVNQNFVPVLDDQKHFIGIITRKAIINYLYYGQKKVIV